MGIPRFRIEMASASSLRFPASPRSIELSQRSTEISVEKFCNIPRRDEAGSTCNRHGVLATTIRPRPRAPYTGGLPKPDAPPPASAASSSWRRRRLDPSHAFHPILRKLLQSASDDAPISTPPTAAALRCWTQQQQDPPLKSNILPPLSSLLRMTRALYEASKKESGSSSPTSNTPGRIRHRRRPSEEQQQDDYALVDPKRIGFVWFILTLKKKMYKYQFGQKEAGVGYYNVVQIRA
ncbi:hypothetical protein ACLOJK_034067 [Asimina triloba]